MVIVDHYVSRFDVLSHNVEAYSASVWLSHAPLLDLLRYCSKVWTRAHDHRSCDNERASTGRFRFVGSPAEVAVSAGDDSRSGRGMFLFGTVARNGWDCCSPLSVPHEVLD
jgi:hypothetical protein